MSTQDEIKANGWQPGKITLAEGYQTSEGKSGDIGGKLFKAVPGWIMIEHQPNGGYDIFPSSAIKLIQSGFELQRL